MQIVKYQPQPDVDAFLFAMYLMYCRAPSKRGPDVDGKFLLNEIGAVPEQSWFRDTPYSIARRVVDEETNE
jgi:hypothetical protein